MQLLVVGISFWCFSLIEAQHDIDVNTSQIHQFKTALVVIKQLTVR